MAVLKRDWKKIVADSEGQMVYLPSSFKGAQDDLDKERKVFNERAIEMAETEIKMNVANQNLFLEIRKHLAKNGYPDIWVKQLGFNAEALKEGVYILNIIENQGR